MTAYLVAKNYAKALFLSAKKNNKLEKIAAELDIFKKSFDANFAHELENPTIAKSDLVNIMKEISSQMKFDDLVTNFFAIVAGGRRLDLFLEIYHEFSNLVMVEKNILSVDLISAGKLDLAQIKQIRSSLEKKYLGKEIIINEVINPKILGGFQIKVASQVIDCSLKGQIESIAKVCKQAIV